MQAEAIGDVDRHKRKIIVFRNLGEWLGRRALIFDLVMEIADKSLRCVLREFDADALDNLVASCKKCNGSKSASYPSVQHLKKLWARLQDGSEAFIALDQIAETTSHLRDASATASKARAVYLNKSEGALLWHAIGEIISSERSDHKFGGWNASR
ncbi:MAG: hypothetical protein EB015_17250 [Methylocystaceae bacterium]|nr:hypothetical protein [Methylocystaceae bacterium]